MRLVISDTSPISNLIAIGQLHLLPALYETIYIPPAVYRELSVLHANLNPITEANWLVIRRPFNVQRTDELA